MANHKSAEKRARQTVKRNTINRMRRTRIQTTVKAVDDAVATGDKALALKAQRKAESVLARSAGRTLHWKTAARRTSRLAKRVKAMKKA